MYATLNKINTFIITDFYTQHYNLKLDLRLVLPINYVSMDVFLFFKIQFRSSFDIHIIIIESDFDITFFF